VLVISDTRTLDTDTGGRAIAELLTAAGHLVVDRRVLKDDPGPVADLVRELAASGIADAVITTGGTGITHRDSTFEAIDGLLDKRLPGFGELFRMLSFEQVGAAAMLSRACAGTCGRLIVLALPGSEKAVRLAMTRLILPELGHLVSEIRR
jgi:molybdenum cofactor biosynthesis protein B